MGMVPTPHKRYVEGESLKTCKVALAGVLIAMSIATASNAGADTAYAQPAEEQVWAMPAMCEGLNFAFVAGYSPIEGSLTLRDAYDPQRVYGSVSRHKDEFFYLAGPRQHMGSREQLVLTGVSSSAADDAVARPSRPLIIAQLDSDMRLCGSVYSED